MIKNTDNTYGVVAKAFHWLLFLMLTFSVVEKTFLSIHGSVWIILVIAVTGHAGVALHHHFIKKDKVLKQMTTGG